MFHILERSQEAALPARATRTTPVTDRSAWTRADVEADRTWLFQLTPRWVQEIDDAVANLRRLGRTLDSMGRDDFPLPTLAAELNRRIWGEVCTGRGFNVMRGLPVERYSDAEVAMIVWGLGQHVAPGVSQNAMGDKLGHVYNQGLDYEARNVRGYQTSHQLKFHTDSGDVLGLMCLRRAREGGLSAISSGTTVFNTLLAEKPHLLPLFFRGFEFDRRGEETPFQKEVSDKLPIFAEVDGDLSLRYVRQAIKTARPKLGMQFDPEELEALDFFDSVAARPEVCFPMMLEPGDMQWVNNYTVLHSRSDYVDWEGPGRERHMLRLWLKIHGFRKLDPLQLDHDPHSGWSRRDGILPRGFTMRDGRLQAAE